MLEQKNGVPIPWLIYEQLKHLIKSESLKEKFKRPLTDFEILLKQCEEISIGVVSSLYKILMAIKIYHISNIMAKGL